MVFDAIHFSYGSFDVLRGVYLKAAPGSVCGLLGRNGSGKSTLMKIGAGLLMPQSGNVFIKDRCVTSIKGAKRFAQLAFLSQKSFLPGEMRVADVLKACHAESVIYRDEIIESISSHKIHAISGGERRYLEFYMVFALDRDFYLLDEPFTGMSPLLIEKMMHVIRERKEEGRGVLLADHYTRYLKMAADDIYELRDGYCRRR